MLKVYANRDHYSEPHRKALNDILKALWNSATREERRAKYGLRAELFEVVSSPEAADVHLLTMKWQHYVEQGSVDQAVRAVEVARRARRPIAVFSGSDYEANFPVPGADIHLFQSSGYRSRRKTTNHGMPSFIADPYPGVASADIPLRDKGARPVIGFCGQAGASLPRHAARVVRNRLQQLSWRLGREQWEPPPFEHTWFRQQIVDTFARSHAVESKFVLRTKYRAGRQTDAERNDPADKARREFVDNVRNTDYTICVRGGGNFSIRFYEAIAMGRMPAFIDTDCVLPFHESIDWRHYTAWVDHSEVRRAPQIVAAFHARMSPAEFKERQIECRRLWEDRLTSDGFYSHFHEHFPELERRR